MNHLKIHSLTSFITNIQYRSEESGTKSERKNNRDEDPIETKTQLVPNRDGDKIRHNFVPALILSRFCLVLFRLLLSKFLYHFLLS